jgi:large subunit ribosomal protein L22
MVRNMPAEAALRHLSFSPKEAAGPVRKLLESAIANAEHNEQADVSKLRIAKITADAGPTLHRWRPRAHGRAAPIRKRTSHVVVILSDESPADVHRSQVKGGKKPSSKTSKESSKKVAKGPSASKEKKAVKAKKEENRTTAKKSTEAKADKKPENAEKKLASK